MGIWDFFQNQILGMRWLNDSVGSLLGAAGMDITTQFGGSLQFFIYDLIKIMLLLIALIYFTSYAQTYFPPERTKAILGRIKGVKGNVAGALLGTVTPFCSCSSIPIFIGFTKAGLPLGVTFSFLISSPLVDLAAITILVGVFGIEVAALYAIVGIAVAVAGGIVIEKMGMEDQIADFAKPGINVIKCACGGNGQQSGNDMTRRERSAESFRQTFATLKKVFPYAVMGVAVGALIHNWIPADVIHTVLGDGNPLSVIIATLMGAPIYADVFGTIPIAEALFGKGVGIGTILSFMMAVTILSIPSLVLLKTVVKTRLLTVFVGVCLAGTILTGYLFNAVF